MLEQILKLYYMAMAGDVRSPTPHLFGPPGCGKSTVVEQAAELIGVNLHVINVARLSPLDVEGVQMPVDMETTERRLMMLVATYWGKLQEGDIILFDEFLRGFPEVYNALLDIFTGRRVGDFVLPKVFIIAASNTTVAYDKALEDRLLHLPVPDPRNNKKVRKALATLIVEKLGLLPQMVESMEMERLLQNEVLPMFEVLDHIGQGHAAASSQIKGHSIRNLIGQVQLREIQSADMNELLTMNNTFCKTQAKHQYMVLPNGNVDSAVYGTLLKLRDHKSLTDVQRLNVEINLQLAEMETARKEGIEVTNDDDNVFLDELD